MKILIKNALALLAHPEKPAGFITETRDIIIEGKHILKVISPDSIAEGSSETNNEQFDKVIDGTGKLVMPGLINAHTHAYMSLFRNFADDEAFWDWLADVQNVELDLTDEDCYWGTLLNCIEMIKTGTTCFVDMNIRSSKGALSGPEGSCSAAANDSGMRAVITRGVAGDTSDNDSMKKFGEALSEMEAFRDSDRIITWFGPHAPYSCMADYLQKITEKGKELSKGQTIHLSESEQEVENMIKDHGMTPIAYVDSLGIFDIPTIAAHCVQATDEDIKIMKEKNVSVAINPKSNMKLGNGFAPAGKMAEAGVNVCLGTDGSGSNNTQNMFAEMNAAALVYKGAGKTAQCISAEDVLTFATANGAKAIGMESSLGVIKEGALADLAILDLNAPQFYPRNNIVSGLVYSCNGSEVETVIINGEIVMEDRRLLTIDESKVYSECERIREEKFQR